VAIVTEFKSAISAVYATVYLFLTIKKQDARNTCTLLVRVFGASKLSPIVILAIAISAEDRNVRRFSDNSVFKRETKRGNFGIFNDVNWYGSYNKLR